MEQGNARAGWLERRLTRRTALRGALAGGLGIASLSVIACSDDPTATPTTPTPTSTVVNPTATPTEGTVTPSATATPTASVSPTATGSVTATPSVTPTPTTSPTPTGTPTPTPTPIAANGKVTWSAFAGDPPGFDPHLQANSHSMMVASHVYSRVMKFRTDPANDSAAPELAPEGDVAESIESGDLQTWLIKVRPNVKWHNRAPANGRAFTAADIKWNLERYIKDGLNKARFVDLIDSFTDPDPSTLEIKLKEPYAGFPSLLASPAGLWLVCREVVENDGDADQNLLGTGPWVAQTYQAGQGLFTTRNADYFVTGSPIVDEFDALQYETARDVPVQFRQAATDLLRTTSVTTRDDVRRTVPEAQLRSLAAQGSEWFVFEPASYASAKAPFNDVRVRQAVSMAIDRDAMLTKFYGGTGKYAAGYLFASFGPWYQDPQSSAFGPNGKYLKFDIAEAKKLMEAAGFAAGVPGEIPVHYTTAYGPEFVARAEQAVVNLKDIGITVRLAPEEFNQYVSTTFLGDFDGMAFGQPPVYTDIDDLLEGGFSPDSRRNHSRIDDGTLNDQIANQRAIAEPAARVAAVQDIVRYSVEQSYYPSTVMGETYYFAHPWIHDWATSATWGVGTESFLRIRTDKRE